MPRSETALGAGVLSRRDPTHEKAAAIRVRGWEIFGFGTQYAWLLALLYGNAFYRLASDAVWAGTVRAALAAGMGLAYAVLYLLRRRLPRAFFSRPVVIGAGAMGTVGSVLICAPVAGASAGVVLGVAALACGFSSATLMIGGNKTWAGLSQERVMMHVALSALAAVVFNYLLLAVPPLACAAVVCALPLGGSFILAYTGRGRRAVAGDAEAACVAGSCPPNGTVRGVRPNALPEGIARRVLVHTAVFALAMGLVVGGMSADFDRGVYQWTMQGMLGALVVCCAVVGIALACDPTTLLSLLARIAQPLMMAGLMLLAALPVSAWGVADACVLGGFIMADLFMWFLNSELVARSRRSSFEVLARSAAVQWAGFWLGTVAGEALWAAELDPYNAVPAFACCAVLLLAERTFCFTTIDAMRIVNDRCDPLEEGRALACARLVTRYGLSARESEVLALLARGRSVPYIQNELGVSQSTAKSHVRNIYRKLAIVSKQALIDLVEQETKTANRL